MAGDCLVIGVGNADYGDDGAGIEVVRALAVEGVPCRVFEGDGLGLIEAWDGLTYVVVVDAAAGGPEPGTFARHDAIAGPLPRHARHGGDIAHGIGLAQAIELARALGRLPPVLVVYAVGASSFVLGEGPAAPVARACAEVARRIGEEIRLFRNSV